MAEGWRYFARRLNGDGTETLIDPDLPLNNVSITRTLSGDDSLSCSISPRHPKLIANGRPVIKEWSTAIYAEYYGEIRGAGIVTDLSENGAELQIDCIGWTGYARDMPYTGPGYAGVEVDPMDVIREVWKHLQSQHGGNIGLVVDGLKTGKKIGSELKQVEFDTQSGPVSFEAGPVKMNWYSTHDLGGFIDTLCKETPLDYTVRHKFNPDGNIAHMLDFGYPRIGRVRKDIALRWGVNVMPLLSFKRSGEDYASGVVVLGGGEGAAMRHTISEPPERPDGRLRRVAVVKDDKLGRKDSLNWRARMELQWRKLLVEIDSVQIINHPSAPIGSIDLGDEVQLLGRGEWSTLSMWVRVVGITFSPESSEVATYKVVRTDKIAEG